MKFPTITRALFLASLAASTPTADAQDRVLGLLVLPDVFGRGACDRYSPRELPLHAAPDGAAVGVIRVVRNWTFHSDGGCEGLEVAVRRSDGSVDERLPTEEHEYEAPAAVVLERRDEWFRLRLATGTAWIHATPQSEFRPLESLYENASTYLTAEWSRVIFDAPGSPGRAASIPANDPQPSVRVLRSARYRGDLWFQIELMSHSGCADPSEPRVIERGWVAAHVGSGQPTIWFNARGC